MRRTGYNGKCVDMNGKAEKTQGAKVRASRAKSRVEAKKKSRAASRTPDTIRIHPRTWGERAAAGG